MFKIKIKTQDTKEKRNARLLMPDLPSNSHIVLTAAKKVALKYPLQMEAARKEHRKVTTAHVLLASGSLLVLSLIGVLFISGNGDSDALSYVIAGVSIPLAVALALPAVLTSRKGALSFLREEAYRETLAAEKRNSSRKRNS